MKLLILTLLCVVLCSLSFFPTNWRIKRQYFYSAITMEVGSKFYTGIWYHYSWFPEPLAAYTEVRNYIANDRSIPLQQVKLEAFNQA